MYLFFFLFLIYSLFYTNLLYYTEEDFVKLKRFVFESYIIYINKFLTLYDNHLMAHSMVFLLLFAYHLKF